MRFPVRPLDMQHLIPRYLAGEGIEPLAQELRTGQASLRKKLVRAGVTIRTQGEAMLLRWQRMTPEERQHTVAAAHEASKGRRRTPEEARRMARLMAKARERNGYAIGRFEDVLRKRLRERGYRFKGQVPIEQYNVDLALGTLAVEVHVSANHPSTDSGIRRRLKDIRERGWNVVYVWVTAAHPLTEASTIKVVALYKHTQLNPALRGQYWVIRGTGEDAHFCPDRHYVPGIPAPVSTKNLSTGRHPRRPRKA